MAINVRITGYMPGGEDRIQWIFEADDGEQWTEEMMQPLRSVVEQEVIARRKQFNNQMDMVNFWRFSYCQLNDLRVYYATRRSWRFLIQGIEGTTWDGVEHHGIEELAVAMNDYNEKHGYLQETKEAQ